MRHRRKELKTGHMQIETWSILSDRAKYVKYDQYPIEHYELRVKAPEAKYDPMIYRRIHESEREVREMSFILNIDSLKCQYVNICEGVKSDVAYTVQYDENSDTGTIYLGMSKMKRQDELKAEHKTSITNDCYV